MMTTDNREKLPADPLEKRPYEAPAILWEETLEIAGTLRASNEPGTPGCGGQGLRYPPPPFGPGGPGR